MTGLVVVQAGLQDLVVDLLPRRGLRFGLVEGGPLDSAALLAANRCLGNPDAAAALECIGRGPTLLAEGGPVRVALTGRLRLLVDGRPCPGGRPVTVQPGSVCTVAAAPPGLRGWLAVGGGLDCPVVFGSRSADRPARLDGLAGRPLAAGERLAVGHDPHARRPAGPGPAPGRPPRAPGSGPWTVRVPRGPQWDAVGPAVRAHLLAQPFTVSPQSDRAGLRLAGAPVPPGAGVAPAGVMLSEGTAFGAVQLTPEGLPLVLLADRGSLGGYPKPLQVTTTAGWQLAQARPGTVLRFRLTTLRAARDAHRRRLRAVAGAAGDRR